MLQLIAIDKNVNAVNDTAIAGGKKKQNAEASDPFHCLVVYVCVFGTGRVICFLFSRGMLESILLIIV